MAGFLRTLAARVAVNEGDAWVSGSTEAAGGVVIHA